MTAIDFSIFAWTHFPRWAATRAQSDTKEDSAVLSHLH
jgi:hypothetical protein